jgi:hypothetical protein
MQVFLRFFLPPTLAYIKKKLYLCTRINDKMANVLPFFVFVHKKIYDY